MKIINLTEELSIKQLDVKNERDRWLIQQLDQDTTTTKYLDHFHNLLSFLDSEEHSTYFDTSYSIWNRTHPVGFLEISRIFTRIDPISFATLEYAILKQERGKQYATTTVRKITELLLEELAVMKIIVDEKNVASEKVAQNSGYIFEKSVYNETLEANFKFYQKTKTMLMQENCRK